MQRDYGGIIWTNHAMARLGQRGLSQEKALKTFRLPEETRHGKNPGSFEYIRTVDGHKVTLVAKQTEKKEWLILSVWVDPPFPGSIDDRRQKQEWEYKKANWWKKILLGFKMQMGL
jgi:CubicO group peptidase (beta-lactamase class C family)